jgi:hypothetical protein
MYVFIMYFMRVRFLLALHQNGMRKHHDIHVFPYNAYVFFSVFLIRVHTYKHVYTMRTICCPILLSHVRQYVIV